MSAELALQTWDERKIQKKKELTALVNSFFTPEEYGYSARACVGADGSADIVDEDSAVQAGEPFFDQLSHSLCIFVTG